MDYNKEGRTREAKEGGRKCQGLCECFHRTHKSRILIFKCTCFHLVCSSAKQTKANFIPTSSPQNTYWSSVCCVWCLYKSKILWKNTGCSCRGLSQKGQNFLRSKAFFFSHCRPHCWQWRFYCVISAETSSMFVPLRGLLPGAGDWKYMKSRLVPCLASWLPGDHLFLPHLQDFFFPLHTCLRNARMFLLTYVHLNFSATMENTSDE